MHTPDPIGFKPASSSVGVANAARLHGPFGSHYRARHWSWNDERDRCQRLRNRGIDPHRATPARKSKVEKLMDNLGF